MYKPAMAIILKAKVREDIDQNALDEFLKKLNPTDDGSLIYWRDYRLWKDDQYLGIPTWTKNENIGDSFQQAAIAADGAFVHNVFTAEPEIKLRFDFNYITPVFEKG